MGRKGHIWLLLLGVTIGGCHGVTLPKYFVGIENQNNWWIFESNMKAWRVNEQKMYDYSGAINDIMRNNNLPPISCLINMSKTGRMLICEAKDNSDYLIDLENQIVKKIPLQCGKDQRIYGYHFNESESKALLTRHTRTDPDDKLFIYTKFSVYIYNLIKHKIESIDNIKNTPCDSSFSSISKNPWLDNDKFLVSITKGMISEHNITKKSTTKYCNGMEAIVLPDNRVLIAKDRGLQWIAARASHPNMKMAALGEGKFYGVPSQDDLDKGLNINMHRDITVSPDGDYILVTVAHVQPRPVDGRLGMSFRVYIRRSDNTGTWLIGGEELSPKIAPGTSSWVAIDKKYSKILGLP